MFQPPLSQRFTTHRARSGRSEPRFGEYRETAQALKKAVFSKGRLGIGDVYWASDTVPPEYAQRELNARTETELLRVTREEGFEIESVIRASRDDWDRCCCDTGKLALVLREGQSDKEKFVPATMLRLQQRQMMPGACGFREF